MLMTDPVCTNVGFLLLLLSIILSVIMLMQIIVQRQCQAATIRDAILHVLWERPGVNSLILELRLTRKRIDTDVDVYPSQIHRLIEAGLVEQTDLSQLFLSEAGVRQMAVAHNEDDVDRAVKRYKIIRIGRERRARQLCAEADAEYDAMTEEELGAAIKESSHQWETAMKEAKS